MTTTTTATTATTTTTTTTTLWHTFSAYYQTYGKTRKNNLSGN